jgi:hypothetical protein
VIYGDGLAWDVEVDVDELSEVAAVGVGDVLFGQLPKDS